MHNVVISLALFFVTSCIPKPTNNECHTNKDCLTCVEAFCSYCGPTPGTTWTGHGTPGCYAPGSEPAFCDPPTHYAFCYHGPTTPIDNREIRRPDGGPDAGSVKP